MRKAKDLVSKLPYLEELCFNPREGDYTCFTRASLQDLPQLVDLIQETSALADLYEDEEKVYALLWGKDPDAFTLVKDRTGRVVACIEIFGLATDRLVRELKKSSQQNLDFPYLPDYLGDIIPHSRWEGKRSLHIYIEHIAIRGVRPGKVILTNSYRHALLKLLATLYCKYSRTNTPIKTITAVPMNDLSRHLAEITGIFKEPIISRDIGDRKRWLYVTDFRPHSAISRILERILEISRWVELLERVVAIRGDLGHT